MTKFYTFGRLRKYWKNPNDNILNYIDRTRRRGCTPTCVHEMLRAYPDLDEPKAGNFRCTKLGIELNQHRSFPETSTNPRMAPPAFYAKAEHGVTEREVGNRNKWKRRTKTGVGPVLWLQICWVFLWAFNQIKRENQQQSKLQQKQSWWWKFARRSLTMLCGVIRLQREKE